MKDIISATTTLTGLIGSPVSKSLSPLIHNTAFQLLGLDCVYLAFDIKNSELEKAVTGLKALQAKGFNVTMPHKQNVMKFLDVISLEAGLTGSVNTVVNTNGRLTGHNTDGKGFVRALEDEGISVKDKHVVIAGAGGSARSVAIQLAMDGASRLTLLNRTLEKVVTVSQIIRENFSRCQVDAAALSERRLGGALSEADIMINCTPLGMYGQSGESIITDAGILRPATVVCDLVYQPPKTRLLRLAEQKGCVTINGLGMLLWQGALAFELWTGTKMPVEKVREKISLFTGQQ